MFLATATHKRYADQIAQHLGLFDEVLATEGDINLSAHRKHDRLIAEYGFENFDYMGNAPDDLEVWKAARSVYVVDPECGVMRGVKKLKKETHLIQTPHKPVKSWLKALRLHQWVKNLLIFVPLLASHRLSELPLLWNGCLAFLFFGLCASSVYLLNDLLDLEDDRHHSQKRHRPFASGAISIKAGILLWPLLLIAAFAGALWLLPFGFAVTMAAYYALTLAYSFLLKRRMAIDVITLAGLYTIRIIAGTFALGVNLTFWMLAFSMFTFLSLALVKRYAELREAKIQGKTEKTRGRGYYPDDLEMLSSLGAASGYLSVMVLALYIQDKATMSLYQHPELIWMACPLLLFWFHAYMAHYSSRHDARRSCCLCGEGSCQSCCRIVIWSYVLVGHMNMKTSWGHFPDFPQTPHATHWRDDLSADYKRLIEAHTTTLAFGQGRSYGDSCLAASSHVLDMSGLDRFISADWENGIIVAEAGVTLGEILNASIPRGWFLPVSPGTKYVTLGGAVANDVHGKNHHVRGTFGCHVIRFKLIRSDQDAMICSTTEHPELFAATIGGLGLTGIIEWIEFQLMPIRSSQIDTTTIRFDSLDDFFTLSEQHDTEHEYSVAWVDCLAKGPSLGRGVLMVGDHAELGPLAVNHKAKIAIPVTPPISMVNSMTLQALNTVYYHQNQSGKKTVDYDPFFYPLDRVLQWNRLYGRKGFQQYQCIIPEKDARHGMHALLSAISDSGQGSFLAVMKRCGDIVSPGMLSFPLPGASLALDFPQNDHLKGLFERLDAVVRETGGRIYPAKDAHMSGQDFRQWYPAWGKLSDLRDPALCSRFWRRVTES